MDGSSNPARSWENWSGSVHCQPMLMGAPCDVDGLRSMIISSDGPVRVRGAGHSFMPVAATDGTLISLDQMPGEVLGVSETQQDLRAHLNAGASLNRLSRAMQAQGMAFKNLGDIDVQSLAGATMTGTHGTGSSFPCLSAEIRAVRLVTASGDILSVSSDDDPDFVNAARVSLGTLGVLFEAEVSVRPAYKLYRRAAPRRSVDVMAEAMSLWKAHRNFEFFALPFSDYSLALTHDETTDADMHEGEGDDEQTLAQLKLLRNLTKRLPRVRRGIMNAVCRRIAPETRVATSWQVLSSSRETGFHEMEYHLPVDQGLEALDEVMRLIEREHPEVFFPIECRMTASDEGWLSPFQGAPRISVAIHAHKDDAYCWFVEKAEPIFRRRGGRPHWGKMHGLTARDLQDLYPDFGKFLKLRSELDPKGRFLNPHLAAMFGGTAA